jgi:hypothetical protein
MISYEGGCSLEEGSSQELILTQKRPERSRGAMIFTEIWRRDPESNWANRICNPGHNRFAIAP